LGVLGFPSGSGIGGAAVLQWETRWFAGGARVVEDDVVRCKSPVRQRVLSRLREAPVRRSAVVVGLVRGVYRSGAADGDDCRGGGSRDNGVVGSCGGVVRCGRYSVCLAEVLGGNLLAF